MSKRNILIPMVAGIAFWRHGNVGVRAHSARAKWHRASGRTQTLSGNRSVWAGCPGRARRAWLWG